MSRDAVAWRAQHRSCGPAESAGQGFEPGSPGKDAEETDVQLSPDTQSLEPSRTPSRTSLLETADTARLRRGDSTLVAVVEAADGDAGAEEKEKDLAVLRYGGVCVACDPQDARVWR